MQTEKIAKEKTCCLCIELNASATKNKKDISLHNRVITLACIQKKLT
jgi:hypothetical protein